mmetsp:Transcript_7495/g.19247  ORF Transcript_7495/g.19247 Transcript_7495/m.19247 type:complete len:255 (-) Transcript_7495:888-1652(-)
MTTRTPLLLTLSAVGALVAATAVNAEYESRCYVHQGCRDGISWIDWGGKYGAGWYCNDWQEPFCEIGECDACAIYSGCVNGATWDGGEWVCDDFDSNPLAWIEPSNTGYNDNCFVHQGCDAGITFIDSGGKYGAGWYCQDWAEPFCGDGLCDACNIHTDCQVGASFDGYQWVCNDSDGSSWRSDGDQWDPCYVHQGCYAGINWEENGPLGRGWYCGDDELADCDAGQCDTCEIRPGCDVGAIWNEDEWMWQCSS